MCFLLLSKNGYACNSCSQISVSSGSGVLMQNMLQDYVSIQYRRVSFFSNTEALDASTDVLTTTELTLKKNITKQLYVWTSVPYQYNIRSFQNDQLQRHGVGDARLGADYRFGNLLKSEDIYLAPIISLGVKAPTGHYEHYLLSQGMPRSFNEGTGAWAALGTATFQARYKKVGAQIAGTFFYQGKNKYDYQYGHQVNFNSTVYYDLSYGKNVALYPSLGVSFDEVLPDTYSSGLRDKSTGGSSWLLQAGGTIKRKVHALTFQYQCPLSQYYAGNTVNLSNVYSCQYTYLFNNRKEIK